MARGRREKRHSGPPAQTEQATYGEAPVIEEGTGRRRLITPVEVQQKVFRLAFRGYNERDVDEFLDHMTEDLAQLHEENKRLREVAADAQAASVPIPPTAQQQAEETVRRAREHASRLLEEAEGRAAAQAAKAPSWFLVREREFLRRLAALIQEHADTLKRQARTGRDHSEQESPEGTQKPVTPSAQALEAAMLAGGQGDTNLEQAQPPLEEPEPVYTEYSETPDPIPTSSPQAPPQPSPDQPAQPPPSQDPADASRPLTASEQFAAPVSRGTTGPPHPWDLAQPGPGDEEAEVGAADQRFETIETRLPEEGLQEIREEVEPEEAHSSEPAARPAGDNTTRPGDEENDGEPSLRELFWGEE